jgi:hypothetical protein
MYEFKVHNYGMEWYCCMEDCCVRAVSRCHFEGRSVIILDETWIHCHFTTGKGSQINGDEFKTANLIGVHVNRCAFSITKSPRFVGN